MSEQSGLKMKVEHAFVAVSFPGDTGYDFHLAEIAYQSLTESTLNDYDFVFAPYQKGHSPTVLFKYTASHRNAAFSFISGEIGEHNSEGKQSYLESVSNLISKLKTTELQKVIYSRTKRVETESLDVFHLYKSLVSKYIEACVFLINIPGLGCWCGATPEILITQEGKNYKTTALAGTQKLVGTVDDVVWDKKEIDEQRFIQTFIKENLETLKINFEVSDTRTVKAGAVCHIKTDFTLLNPHSIINVVNSLHPGPAISGYPKQKAIQTIAAFENYDRKYYTGFFGSLAKGKLQLYINLRSMEIFKNCCLLYLGGGITKDSSPVKEWEETELKSTTLGSLLSTGIVQN